MTVSSAACPAAIPEARRPPRPRAAGLPGWAEWNRAQSQRYTIGIEEEALLLDADGSLSQCSDWVLPRLSAKLRAHSAPETHAAVIELATGVHAAVTPAVAELAALRLALASELDEMGLTAASAGMYPLQSPAETRVSGSERYRRLVDSMRSLARREPTLALHVHIGIPDPEEAVRLLNGLRPALPILIALAANSPFSEGRDTGFASARTVTFHAFPRTGIARRFAGYRDYVRAVDPLLDSGALPDPSFLWWDVRLQPALGTVEIRVMDAQVAVADTAALVALVTSLARSILEGGRHDPEVPPEVLSENRFLAARDGLDAHLIDSERKRLVPARRLLDALLERCSRHADEIGSIELARVARLATANGAERQRAWTRAGGLDQLPRMLSQRFASVQAPAIPR